MICTKYLVSNFDFVKDLPLVMNKIEMQNGPGTRRAKYSRGGAGGGGLITVLYCEVLKFRKV